jgi:clathrin heavy chain
MGVNSDAIKFGTCTMESDKVITVCETAADGSKQVVIIEMDNNNNMTRKPMAAEAAIMNPVTRIIALRAGTTLQIVNLDLKAKMKTHQMPEAPVFWRWASPSLIALVTATSVYHWSIEGSSEPQKVFDRNAALGAGTQIINYHLSPDSKWCLLGGISQGAGGAIVGSMQLYSMDKKVSQVLSGHAGCFTTIKPEVDGRTDSAVVLVFHEKKEDQ